MGLDPFHKLCILSGGRGLDDGFEFVAIALQIVTRRNGEAS